MPKAVEFLQILLKVYTKCQISLRADLANIVKVVQEKISVSNSLQSPCSLVQKVFERYVFGAFLKGSFFVSN